MSESVLTKQEIESLRTKCLDARDLSYSPYSKFRVGCAILTKKGTIFTGANVENASYGAGICAERTTILRCLMEGQREFRAIAISSDMDEPITPCGICRQFIREFSKDVPILMFSGKNEEVVCRSLQELLPMSFGPEHLQ